MDQLKLLSSGDHFFKAALIISAAFSAVAMHAAD